MLTLRSHDVEELGITSILFYDSSGNSPSLG